MSGNARSAVRKNEARKRLEAPAAAYSTLTLEQFRIVSDWYHFAILELCQTRSFESSTDFISRRLGVEASMVEAAVGRLRKLELLTEQNGRLAPTEDFTASPSGIPSEAIRSGHRQILDKAYAAVETQNVEERDISTMTLAFDRSRLQEAQTMIREFRRAFDARFAFSAEKDDVYALAIQFFKLTLDNPAPTRKETAS